MRRSVIVRKQKTWDSDASKTASACKEYVEMCLYKENPKVHGLSMSWRRSFNWDQD